MSDDPKHMYSKPPEFDWVVIKRRDFEDAMREYNDTCPPGSNPIRCKKRNLDVMDRVQQNRSSICQECIQEWKDRSIYKLTAEEARELGFNPSTFENLKQRRLKGEEK